MLDVGRLCVKTAGRDAGKTCVIVDTLENDYLLVDGETRRRKVSSSHVEPLDRTINVPKGASHEQVVHAFKTIGIELTVKKAKAPKVEQAAKTTAQKK